MRGAAPAELPHARSGDTGGHSEEGSEDFATVARFAAELSARSNENVCTSGIDALVYNIEPKDELIQLAFQTLIFERNIKGGRAMMSSLMTAIDADNQGK